MRYKQCFKEEWLNGEIMKDWRKEDPSEKGCSYCICCKTKIRNANESMLLSHSKTAKHENNMKAAKFTTKLDIYVKKRKPTEIEEVAKAELINILFHCRTSYAICSDRSSCRRVQESHS